MTSPEGWAMLDPDNPAHVEALADAIEAAMHHPSMCPHSSPVECRRVAAQHVILDLAAVTP